MSIVYTVLQYKVLRNRASENSDHQLRNGLLHGFCYSMHEIMLLRNNVTVTKKEKKKSLPYNGARSWVYPVPHKADVDSLLSVSGVTWGATPPPSPRSLKSFTDLGRSPGSPCPGHHHGARRPPRCAVCAVTTCRPAGLLSRAPTPRGTCPVDRRVSSAQHTGRSVAASRSGFAEWIMGGTNGDCLHP